MRSSSLAQVHRGNVAQLQQAWFYRVEGEAIRVAFNPVIVDGVMYVRGADDRLVALDAATGREIWRSTEEAFSRGVSYWESADRADRRLMVTTNAGLRQVDARTGRLVTTFGTGGTVDMRQAAHAASAAPARRLAASSRTC